jgi:hypothetical protein
LSQWKLKSKTFQQSGLLSRFSADFLLSAGENTMTRFDYFNELLTESEMMDRALKGLRHHQACLGGPAPVQETIVNSEYREYLAAKEKRRKRSLQSCHRFSLYERPRHAPPRGYGRVCAAGLRRD